MSETSHSTEKREYTVKNTTQPHWGGILVNFWDLDSDARRRYATSGNREFIITNPEGQKLKVAAVYDGRGGFLSFKYAIPRGLGWKEVTEEDAKNHMP
jgi:hypothetical protein